MFKFMNANPDNEREKNCVFMKDEIWEFWCWQSETSCWDVAVNTEL